MLLDYNIYESYAKELKIIHLSNDTVYRRINDISTCIQQELESELGGNLCAIILDGVTCSSYNAYVICYITFWKGTEIIGE